MHKDYVFEVSRLFPSWKVSKELICECLNPILFWSMQVQFLPSTAKYSQTLKDQKIPSAKISGTVKQTNFEEKSWFALLCTSFSDTWNFQKHRKVDLRICSVLSDKKLVMKNMIPTFCSVSPYQKLSETLKRTSHEIFLGNKKFSTTFCDMFHQTCGQPQKLPEIRKGIPLIFRYCETESFRQVLVIPSYDLRKFSRQTEEQGNVTLSRFQLVWLSDHEILRKKIATSVVQLLCPIPETAIVTQTSSFR